MTTFTDQHKSQIRKYLGYPVSEGFKSQIATRCTAVENIDSEAVEDAIAMLGQLKTFEKQIRNVTPFASQTFSSNASGTQQHAPGQRTAAIEAEARKVVLQLSDILTLPVHRDIFSGGGWKSASTVRA